MVADTFSSGLGYLIMGTGNDNNIWGDNANNDVFQVFEDAISNQLFLNVTGGTLDLSGNAPPAAPSQARYSVIQVNGALASTQTIILPNTMKLTVFFNGCTGPFGVIIKGASAVNSVGVPHNKHTIVRTNSSGLCARLDAHMVGTYVDGAAGPPPGALFCDGAIYQAADYPDLFSAFGNLYGGNGITTFGVPNTRDTGRYRRSVAPGLGLTLGTVQASAIGSHNHTASVTDPTHTHGVNDPTHNHGINDPQHSHGVSGGTLGGQTLSGISGGGVSNGVINSTNIIINNASTGITIQNHSTGVSNQNASTGITVGISNTGGSETRPESIVATTCIWY